MHHIASELIRELQLLPHPEGGYFRETYRSAGLVPKEALGTTFNGSRSFSTAIYFLLEGAQFSAFHRLLSDECWHFYQGLPLNIYVLHPPGDLEIIRLGSRSDRGEVCQAVVPAGRWFASRLAGPGTTDGYALVGCTVSPGFDFADFQMAQAGDLLQEFPGHAEVIRSLCL